MSMAMRLLSLLTPFASWDALWLVLIMFGPLLWIYLSDWVKNCPRKKKKSGILRGGKYTPDYNSNDPHQAFLNAEEVISFFSWEYSKAFMIWILGHVWSLLVWAFLRVKLFVRQTRRRYFYEPPPQVQFAEQPDGTIRTTNHTFDPKEAPSSDWKKKRPAIHLSTTPSSTHDDGGSDGFTTPTNQQQQQQQKQQQPLRRRAQLHTPPPPPDQWKQDITMSEEKKPEEEARSGKVPAAAAADNIGFVPDASPSQYDV
jgi:hypothetical protein